MKREARIEVRVTPEELQRFKQAAELSGATLSSWVRIVLLSQLTITSDSFPTQQQ